MILFLLALNLFYSFNSYSKIEKFCIAHRGNSSEYLENSMQALLSAKEVGAHGIEFDIRHTFDEKAIIIHDPELKDIAVSKPNKTCDLKTKIKMQTFNQIQKNCLLKNGESIATLEEVLIALKDFNGFLFIELKDLPPNHTLALIAQFRKNKKKEKTRLLSFKKKYLTAARNYHKSDYFKNLKMLKNNRFFPFSGKRFGLNLQHTYFFTSFLSKFSNKEIGAWTINKSSKMKKFIKKKRLKFITTNKIRLCLKINI